jgi:hypothetical protein
MILMKYIRNKKRLKLVLKNWNNGIRLANEHEMNEFIEKRYFRRIIMKYRKR